MIPFEPWVGFRYLVSKRSSVFVSFISAMTIFGVVLGVAALNVVIAVMSGFEEDLKGKIIGMNAHAIVATSSGTFAATDELERTIRETDGVVGVTPYTTQELLLQSGSQVSGVIVKGTDPKTVGGVTEIVRNVCLPDEIGEECGEHRDERLDERQKILERIGEEVEINEEGRKVLGVLLGQDLADSLFVEEGDTVQLVTLTAGVGPGGVYPKVRTFYVVGTFKTGLWEYDQKFAFASLAGAERLSGTSEISGYEIRTRGLYEAPAVARRIAERLPATHRVRTWADVNSALFHALRLEKFVMGLLLSIITIVASFSIVSILTLIVLEKAKEIAILKSMGAKDSMILGIFATEGFTIGALGVLIGTIVGLGVASGLKAWEWKLDPNVYPFTSLPVVLDWRNFAVVAIVGLAITFVATVMPSAVAARTNPVEGLAYE